MENNLKEAMTKKGKSIDDLAKLANVSVNTVRNWRKKDKLPPSNKIGQIADYLGMEASDIFKI